MAVLRPRFYIDVFGAGQGDPYCVDHGFASWEALAESAARGTIPATAGGLPLVDVLPGVGLILRPQVTALDTLMSHFTRTGGTWDEYRPATGPGRVIRMMQTSAEPNLTWSARYNSMLPARFCEHIRIVLHDAPAGHDDSALPPQVRIALGDSDWGVLLRPRDGVHIVRRIAGTWRPVQQVQANAASFPGRGREYALTIMCDGTRLWVTGTGEWGDPYVAPDGPIDIPEGDYTIYGQGGQCIIAHWQCFMQNATYRTQPRGTTVVRAVSPSITARTTLPTGTSATPSDASTLGTDVVAADIALAPASHSAGRPWTHYTTPIVHSVSIVHAEETAGGLGTFDRPLDNRSLSVTINRPLTLTGSSARIAFELRPGDLANLDAWRDRKVRIWMGWVLDDEVTEQIVVAFTGYVRSVQSSQQAFGPWQLVLDLDNVAARLQGTQWGHLYVRPLSNGTISQASDLILAHNGLQAGIWPAAGAYVLTDPDPAVPFELIDPQETPYQTLERIWGYVGHELAVTVDGRMTALPIGYQSGTTHLYSATGSTPETSILSVTHGLDFRQSCTAVQASSGGAAPQVATIVDTAAESLPVINRFAGRRIILTEEISGAPASVLAARAAAMAQAYIPVPRELQIRALNNIAVGQRDRVLLEGLESHGVPGGTLAVILTQSISLTRETAGDRWEADMTCGLRVI